MENERDFLIIENFTQEEINEEFNILNEKLFEKRHLTEENEIKLYEILKRGFYPSNKKNQKNHIIISFAQKCKIYFRHSCPYIKFLSDLIFQEIYC